jgi:hypothetical protein
LVKHLVPSEVTLLSNEQHQTELYVKPICQPKNSHTHKRPASKRDTGKAGRVDPLTHRMTIQVNNRNNEVNVFRTAGSPTHTDTDRSARVSVTVSCSIDHARVVELLTTKSSSRTRYFLLFLSLSLSLFLFSSFITVSSHYNKLFNTSLS